MYFEIDAEVMEFVFARTENMVEKNPEKMLVTNIFSFSHNVFERL